MALKIISTTRIVSETRAWIERRPDLRRHKVPWDNHGEIATKSGPFNFTSTQLGSWTPEHWATHWIEVDYDPAASCPLWLQMLGDAGLDAATQSILQELLGVAMVDEKPRGLVRALVLVGGSNSGKSNILRTMAEFLSEKPINTPLELLENPHGTQDFLRRA